MDEMGIKDEYTVERTESLRDAMRKIDRTGSDRLILVNEDNEFVDEVTAEQIREEIFRGTSQTEPIATVVDESGTRTDPDVRSADRPSETVRKVRPLPKVDEDGVVTDVDLRHTEKETVLVIGGAGYVGSVLSELLLQQGYRVRVLDNLLYGARGVEDLRGDEDFTLQDGDIRSLEVLTEAIEGVDAVCHLGAIVGDPACAIDPQKTIESNYHATRTVAELCKYHQVNRFVFASTCSVYGKSSTPESMLREDAALNPVSLYARTKIESERRILAMEDENFSPTVLRKATVYGLSPRMRFDLVVNVLSAKANSEGEVPVFGGDQYRPNVHVEDAARAYLSCLEAPIETVSGEVFNVGSNEQNYQIMEIGEIVADCFPEATIDHQAGKEDERSYCVDFTKIHERLDYDPQWTVRDGCLEIKEFLRSNDVDYTDEAYSNYETLESETSPLGTH